MDTDFVAYEVQPADDMPLARAGARRRWMDESDARYAYRCLPLAIANQCGWTIACPASFAAWWTGGPAADDVRLDFGDAEPDPRVASHFGLGVVTFSLPYLFRTPSGVVLWVKGPANDVRDGVQALEGVVETDWSVATFTMNWKLTRPDHVVRFEAGEPICMVVPLDRALVERLEPRRAGLADDPALAAAYEEWERSRAAFNDALAAGEEAVLERGWQKDYFRGRAPDGTTAPEHRTKLALRDFEP